MSVPEPIREPKTQEEFAKKFKVSEQTLSAWKKRDDFWEAVKVEWKKWGREKTADVMQEFYNSIKSEGRTSDFKLWFQYFLDWQEKSEHNIPQLEGLKALADSIKKLAGE